MIVTPEVYDRAPRTSMKGGYNQDIWYRIIDGTAFHVGTPRAVVQVLLDRLGEHRNLVFSECRVTLYYGFTEAAHPEKDPSLWGRCWGESERMHSGTIGRSGGRIKVPLLLSNVRSHGGGAIMDDCIVGIRYANKRKGGFLYKHPKFRSSQQVQLDEQFGPHTPVSEVERVIFVP